MKIKIKLLLLFLILTIIPFSLYGYIINKDIQVMEQTAISNVEQMKNTAIEDSNITTVDELIRLKSVTGTLSIQNNIELMEKINRILQEIKDDGKVIFNWRTVMAPVSAIDYVIVHELCHFKESLHSLEFWDLLESIFPEYKKWKEWLRINGLTLDIEFI